MKNQKAGYEIGMVGLGVMGRNLVLAIPALLRPTRRWWSRLLRKCITFTGTISFPT